jgi:hypothetical protein
MVFLFSFSLTLAVVVLVATVTCRMYTHTMMNYLFSSPTVQYCEAATNMLIARPWYAISNVAFLVIGILILFRGGRHSRLFGSVALLVGSLSFLYDATYTYLSQLIDLSGMLVLVSILLYLNLRLFLQKQSLITGLAVSFIIALYAIITLRGFAGDIVFGLLVLSYVVSEIYLLCTKRHIKKRRWLLAFGVFLLGFIFWLCDASHLYCANIGLFNGRAIFHYANTMTIYLLFIFYGFQAQPDLVDGPPPTKI